jgi:hypothetical protein
VYFLIDLERSIISGNVFYWSQNKEDFTRGISEAGKFTIMEAVESVNSDFDNRIIMVSEDTVKQYKARNVNKGLFAGLMYRED